MIPKIIHQLWIGPKPAPLRLMNTWREKNPNWQYFFWDEAKLQEYFPRGLANQLQFELMPEWNGKCDIARYEILHEFGGFFIDADSVCLRPLDDFVLDNDSFTCYENEKVRGTLVAAGYLASTRGNLLMQHLIRAIHEISLDDLSAGNKAAWLTVGPVLLTKTINRHSYTAIKIYPSHYFIPEHYSGITYTGKDIVYAKQFWGSTAGSVFNGYNNEMIDELLK